MVFALVLVACINDARAQIYRWTDESGRSHITDTPPPPSAKNVQKRSASVGKVGSSPAPFSLQQAQTNFPVTLYTSPSCSEPCALARTTLNKRGVPFKEEQVWNEETNERLKKISGDNQVPVITVGRSVQKGIEPSELDALLDTAGYPKSGVPARTQQSPPPPEGYAKRPPEPASPIAPAESEKPQKLGPYAPAGR